MALNKMIITIIYHMVHNKISYTGYFGAMFSPPTLDYQELILGLVAGTSTQSSSFCTVVRDFDQNSAVMSFFGGNPGLMEMKRTFGAKVKISIISRSTFPSSSFTLTTPHCFHLGYRICPKSRGTLLSIIRAARFSHTMFLFSASCSRCICCSLTLCPLQLLVNVV